VIHPGAPPPPGPGARQTDGGYDWGLTDKCGQCFEVLCVNGPTRGEDWSDLGPWGGCQARHINLPHINLELAPNKPRVRLSFNYVVDNQSSVGDTS